MKKRYKLLLGAAALIATPIAINRCIEKRASLRANYKSEEQQYQWHFGNVKYVKRGQGKPLLLLHGLFPGAGAHEWDECLNALSRHYTVYVPDLLGFGNSHKPQISYSAYLYTSFINDFIDSVICEPCYVAACGAAASCVVQSVKFKPDNFKKILLISPEGLEKTEEKCPCLGKFIELPVYGTFVYNILCSIPNLWMYLKRYIYSPGTKISKENLMKYYNSAHYGGHANKYLISQLLSGGLSWDISKSINDINKPVHIIWGDENPTRPPQAISKLMESKESFEFTSFESAGMLPHWEEPFKFVRLTMGFFS